MILYFSATGNSLSVARQLAVMHFAAFPLATIPGAVFSVWHNISGATAARIYLKNNAL